MRLQDIIKSILNSWLIEEFNIFHEKPSSTKIINMINFFDKKITVNYVVPKQIDKSKVNFLHGSFYEKDEIRKHKTSMTVENRLVINKSVENYWKFFEKLKYVHLSNKYGLSEQKNMDNLKYWIGSPDEQKSLEEYKRISESQKSIGLKTQEPRTLQKEDYKSYDELIKKSDVIIIYGLNPNFDEHLIEISSRKSQKLIFVWYSEEDRKKARKIMNHAKDKLVWYEDFLNQYKKINLLEDNFKHTKIINN